MCVYIFSCQATNTAVVVFCRLSSDVEISDAFHTVWRLFPCQVVCSNVVAVISVISEKFLNCICLNVRYGGMHG